LHGFGSSVINPTTEWPNRARDMMTKKKSPVPVKKTPTVTKNNATAKTSSAVEGPNAAEVQLKTYEQAIQLFSHRKLAEARDRFREVAKGPAPHIADKARSYAQVCDRRLQGTEVALSTAEDHFNYGVERLNARELETAKHHLGRALDMKPDADHVLYTLALCCGIAGDGTGACENLKRAIDLEPRNRILARQDPEFSTLATQIPGLRALLVAESPGPGSY
jgi:tetratricopeptide (TPR) repeat protein